MADSMYALALRPRGERIRIRICVRIRLEKWVCRSI